MLDLLGKNQKFSDLLVLMFDDIIALGPDVRPPDVTPRTGIHCCIKEPQSRNIIMPYAYTPSVVAMHLSSEKIGRAFEKGYYSSRIGADPKKFEFPGGLIAKYGWIMVLIGVSGLLSDEDEMAAFVLHSHLLKLSPNKLKTVIYPNEASVPWEVFNPDGYIWRTLSPYCYKH